MKVTILNFVYFNAQKLIRAIQLDRMLRNNCLAFPRDSFEFPPP